MYFITYYVHNKLYNVMYITNINKFMYRSLMNVLVKLKKVLSRRDKQFGEYYRYDVTIPNSIIDELGWDKVKELDFEIKNKKLELKKK